MVTVNTNNEQYGMSWAIIGSEWLKITVKIIIMMYMYTNLSVGDIRDIARV